MVSPTNEILNAAKICKGVANFLDKQTAAQQLDEVLHSLKIIAGLLRKKILNPRLALKFDHSGRELRERYQELVHKIQDSSNDPVAWAVLTCSCHHLNSEVRELKLRIEWESKSVQSNKLFDGVGKKIKSKHTNIRKLFSSIRYTQSNDRDGPHKDPEEEGQNGQEDEAQESNEDADADSGDDKDDDDGNEGEEDVESCEGDDTFSQEADNWSLVTMPPAEALASKAANALSTFDVASTFNGASTLNGLKRVARVSRVTIRVGTFDSITSQFDSDSDREDLENDTETEGDGIRNWAQATKDVNADRSRTLTRSLSLASQVDSDSDREDLDSD